MVAWVLDCVTPLRGEDVDGPFIQSVEMGRCG